MTERLYYADSYLTSFDSPVVERGDDGRRLYLERTAFYPTSGGQPHDVGTLDGIPVVDVIDEGERIAHVLAAPAAREVLVVRGSVDWARRFDHMQQHTGQHLVSAVFAERFGHATVSVHFGADYSTLDLDGGTIGREQLVAAEEQANSIVWENRPVRVSMEAASEVAGLRKASERGGTLRIVSIADLDRSACGGTHVRATGEIGPILLRKVEKVRKSMRVEFVCGGRAIRRARVDYEAMTRIAGALSASIEEAPGLVASQVEQMHAAEKEARRLERELAGYRAKELYDASGPDSAGVRRVVVRRDRGPADELRALAQALLSLPRSVFVGAIVDPPSVMMAASEDSGVDAAAVLRAALVAAGGRGGGSPRLAQGSVPNVEQLEAVMTAIGSAT
jgi:alanyl-tRNA synthetase